MIFNTPNIDVGVWNCGLAGHNFKQIEHMNGYLIYDVFCTKCAKVEKLNFNTESGEKTDAVD